MKNLKWMLTVLTLASAALAQERPTQNQGKREPEPHAGQIVALDECDPATFNAALGADFCRNVAIGASTKLADLFAKAAAGTPDPVGTLNLTQSRSSKERL
jgi:hypothetical protein